MIKEIKGYLVRIDWSQTDQDTVCVIGAKTQEEAIEAVKKTNNCPRIYRDGSVNRIIDLTNSR
jgi:hypothetical protein